MKAWQCEMFSFQEITIFLRNIIVCLSLFSVKLSDFWFRNIFSFSIFGLYLNQNCTTLSFFLRAPRNSVSLEHLSRGPQPAATFEVWALWRRVDFSGRQTMYLTHLLTLRDVNQDPPQSLFYLKLYSQQHAATEVQHLAPMRPSKVFSQLLFKCIRKENLWIILNIYSLLLLNSHKVLLIDTHEPPSLDTVNSCEPSAHARLGSSSRDGASSPPNLAQADSRI